MDKFDYISFDNLVLNERVRTHITKYILFGDIDDAGFARDFFINRFINSLSKNKNIIDEMILHLLKRSVTGYSFDDTGLLAGNMTITLEFRDKEDYQVMKSFLMEYIDVQEYTPITCNIITAKISQDDFSVSNLRLLKLNFIDSINVSPSALFESNHKLEFTISVDVMVGIESFNDKGINDLTLSNLMKNVESDIRAMCQKEDK